MLKWIYTNVESNLKNGYISNLFSWIEWVTLTGIVLAVGLKFKSTFFLVITAVLGIILYLSALIGSVHFVSLYASKWKLPEIAIKPFSFIVVTVVSWSLFYILVVSLIAVFKQ